jgi:phosphoserine phosphatase
MGGGMPFHEALQRRLEIMSPTLESLDAFLAMDSIPLSPGIADVVATLQSQGKHVYLVSGGFTESIHHLADKLNISREHVYANTMIFRPE